MSISRRTILSVGVTLVALLGLIHLVASNVMLDGFGRVERTLTRQNTLRAQQALDGVVAQLSTTLADWANWDETYRFAADANDEYVRSNLAPQSLALLGLSFVAVFDPEGELVHAVALDRETERLIPLPPAIDRMIREGHPILRAPSEDAASAGLLSCGATPYAVATRPILTSDYSGPPRGMMLFGQALDEALMGEIAERLRMDVRLRTTEGAPTGLRERISGLTSGQPLVTIVDEEHIRGSMLLTDVDGRPSLVIEIRTPRFVWQQAQATKSLLFLTLVAAGVGAVVITTLVLRVVVLRRLALLHEAVGRLREPGDLASGIPIRGRDEFADFAAAVNDLLDRVRRSGEELTSAKESAERADRAKTEFLAHMSHEVRTPMTAILGYAELLSDRIDQSDLNPDDCAQIIRRNAGHLLALLNDILDFSKIEAGRFETERITCSPREIVRETITLLHEGAERKGLRLDFESSPSFPERIRTDPTRLRQILINLAGNAIKFTRRGFVTIRGDFDARAERILIDVIDSGIGIRPEQAERIFIPFSQADASTSRHHGGTGLGLAISRRLAELLGGSLELLATGSEGSAFRLSLPAGAAEEHAPPSLERSAPEAEEPAPLHGARLLLAEDGPDNRRLIEFLLRRAGAELDVVEEGRSAVDAALAAQESGRPYELVLMDLEMPIMDGFDAARALRRRGVTTPILALTARAMDVDREACFAAGFDGFESKPIDRARLLAVCRDLLRRSRKRAA